MSRRNKLKEINKEATPINVPSLSPNKAQELQTSSLENKMKDVENTLSNNCFLKSLISIDSFVERTYLNEISSAEIVPLKKKIVVNNKTKEVFNIPANLEYLPSFRWFRIDKIVYEKNVFFTDKFSMLFAALHKEAAQVVLVLDKKNGITKLFLGARDNDNKAFNRSGETLEAGLRGFLTGVHTSTIDNDDMKKIAYQYNSPSVACVSGVASLRDDNKETFVQGLERLINSTASIPSYSAFFVADSVNEQERIEITNAFQKVYRQLSPLEELQMSLTKTETATFTETITEGISNTTGKTIGRTITNGTTYTKTTTKTEGKSITDGKSSGWNLSKSNGWSLNLTPFGIGGSFNRNKAKGEHGGTNHAETKLEQIAEAISKGEMHQASDLTQQLIQETKSKQNSLSNSQSSSEAKTLQITTKDLHVKDLMETIESQIKRLRNAAPFGLWNCATYFISNNESTSRKIANIYKGTIVGEESGLEISSLNSWTEGNPIVTEIVKYLENGLNPRFIIDGENVSAGTTVSSKELAIHMALPQNSVPGIVVQTKASFGRNVTKYSSIELEDENVQSQEYLDLGNILHLGEKDVKNKVCLSLDDLKKHTFVTGTTGSGKSNVMYLILDKLYNSGKKFMVIEPKKGEYKKIFGGLSGVKVYSSNPYESLLLTINPFSFDYKKGIMVYEHVDRLVEIFNACWPMYAAMPAVLKKSILDAYNACGWNTKLSKPADYNNVLFPTIEDVIFSLRKFINNSEYSGDTKSDYKGAIETRLLELTEGVTGLMLNSQRDIANEDLFDNNVIIDLHRIGNSETVSLIMGIIILKLNEYRMACCDMNENLQHVTVIEEAHNILKRTSSIQSQESANLIGKSVEMISNSIAEMRTYGEGFIIVDQSPAQVDMSAIRNTNTKIILALPDEEDRKTAGKSIGLSDEQIEEISKQKTGQAIVYQNDWEEAVQCSLTEYKSRNPFIKVTDYEILSSEENRSYINPDVIRFLVAGRLNVRPLFNLNAVQKSLASNRIPSSIKHQISLLVKEFNESGTCRIWKDSNFKELSELVSAYINKEDEVHYIMCKKSKADVNELTNSIAELLKDDLQTLLKGEVFTVIQCLMRYQSSKSIEMMKVYDYWKNN